jgi:non-specific serine/threonine protein kinase
MTDQRRSTLSFPPFRIPGDADVLYRGDEVVSLERQAVRVLRYLAERRERVVSKEELLDNVWADVFTADSVLKRAVSLARRALGDDPSAPRFIRTVHRQGYQFVAPVTCGEEDTDSAPTIVDPPKGTSHNLVHPLTSFVGRREALAAIARELETARLVTLHGPGGMGKTRLSIELAWASLDAFPDGVWLVELAATSDPARVAAAVAEALGVRDESARPLAAAIADAIGEGSVLVVLDNCEHVVGACADLAERLLGRCRNLRVLATSREPLDVPGETVWPVAALDLPETGEMLSLDRLRERESVRLFLERARSARPDAAFTDENVRAVAELCRALDGLPLAIELAAARVRTMSVDEILARMKDRFSLLARAGRAPNERHRTLRATVDWSFDMLSADERALFRRLAAFEGGCSGEAAAGVCFGPAGTRDDAVDLLARLVEKALVVADEHDGLTRYRMLESIREYAAEKLREAGEEEEVRRRHRDWYLDWSERFRLESTGDGEVARWRVEEDNLRAALRWSLETSGELAASLDLCLNLAHAWRITGNWSEGRRWLDALLARGAELPREGLPMAVALAGALACEQGDHPRARPLLEEAVRLHREAGDRAGAAVALQNLAYALGRLGEHEAAEARRSEAVDLFRLEGDERAVGIMCSEIGAGARERGDYEAALASYSQALEATRRAGDALNTGVVLYNLGELAVDRGDYEAADALLAESLSIARDLGVPRVEAYALHMSAFAATGSGKPDRAAARLDDALAIHRSQGNDEGVAYVLSGFAMLSASSGEWERALELAGAAEALRERIGSHATPADQLLMDRALEPARVALGGPSAELARAAGRALSADAALARARRSSRETAPVDLPTPRPRPVAETAVLPADVLLPRADRSGSAGALRSLIGSSLDGRYELTALLGRGGMGAVYQATDLRLGRQVAVKTMRTDLQHNADALERFGREAQLVARLRHPNIVAVHDFGSTADDLLYIVMELLEGHTLRHELRGGALDAGRAVAIARQACSAVAAAHAAGVIHRDLKPDNLFLEAGDGPPRVKVLDFGVARVRELEESEAPLTRPGAVVGTPRYMAPEQCEGRSADERSDVYTLGCVLYEMVTGSAPFTAESSAAMLYKHIHEEPRSPAAIVRDLPASLETAILRALSKLPADRFATAAEMERALSGVASSQ